MWQPAALPLPSPPQPPPSLAVVRRNEVSRCHVHAGLVRVRRHRGPAREGLRASAMLEGAAAAAVAAAAAAAVTQKADPQLVQTFGQRLQRRQRRLRRRATLLNVRFATSVKSIFNRAAGGTSMDIETLQEASDAEFVRRLAKLRQETDKLIGADEEVMAVATQEAEAAADSDGEELESSGFRAVVDKLLSRRYRIDTHDVCARRADETGSWIVPVEAWLFRENRGRDIILCAICQKLLAEMRHGIRNVDAAAQERYEERARLVFRTVAFRGGEGGHQLKARFTSADGAIKGEWRTLPMKTDRTGQVKTGLRLSAAQVEELLPAGPDEARGGELVVEVRTALPGARARATVRLAEAEGLSVISDIDDTVKVTEVFISKDAVTRNTFFEEFRAVPGMPELFKSWESGAPGMTFHFVSNSPPELLEPLRTFLCDSGFPHGAPLHLRPLRGEGRENFKANTIEELLRQFPGRRFILVGDSGERDSNIYADFARRFPNQIAKILIREVHPSRPVDEAAVFHGLRADLYQVFREPSEVQLQLREFRPQFT